VTATQARRVFEQQVLPLFEETREDWLKRARAAAESLAAARPAGITINDVREVCPPPRSVDPRVMGAVFTPKRWERCGFTLSDRLACHGRPIGVFRPRVSTKGTGK
jgi:hypothetical protein